MLCTHVTFVCAKHFYWSTNIYIYITRPFCVCFPYYLCVCVCFRDDFVRDSHFRKTTANHLNSVCVCVCVEEHSFCYLGTWCLGMDWKGGWGRQLLMIPTHVGKMSVRHLLLDAKQLTVPHYAVFLGLIKALFIYTQQ